MSLATATSDQEIYLHSFDWKDKKFVAKIKEGSLVALSISKHPKKMSCPNDQTYTLNQKLGIEVEKQILAFLNHSLKIFDLPLEAQGTDFQKKVWNSLRRIPYGETRSYKQVALELGGQHMARAVGQANGANPIPLVVPCHRVITSQGALGGFSLGVEFKQELLSLEARSI